MRCHRGFWVYAAEHGEDVVSGNAARFAREQVAQELPGVNKAAENWLRSRAGRALRARWLGQSPAERLRYITDNPDVSFPLADNPSGMADLRRDRSRYPTMVRVPVSTPQVLLAGPTDAALDAPPLDKQTQEQFEAFEGYRGDLMRAATTAELTVLAYAHRQSNVDRVVDSSVALVECMGVQMAASIPDTYRQRILEITREVARQLRATKTQMTVNLHTDTECQAVISEARESVNAADNVLRSFVHDYVGVNPTFAAMNSNRDYYRPVGTKLLKNFYWLGGANCTDSAGVNLSRADGVPVTVYDNSTVADSSMAEPAAMLAGLAAAGSHASDVAASGPAHEDTNHQASLSSSPPPPSQSRKRQKKTQDIGGKLSCGESSEEYLSEEASSEGSLFDDTNKDSTGHADSHWFFRARVPRNTPLVIWKDTRDSDKARVIHVYQEDLDSLLADGLLTATVLDYFIFRFMPRVDGLLCVCGTGMYAGMETAKYTRSQQRKRRLINELSEQFDWTSYKYVLLPVCGRNHWSFLVVENPMHEDPTKVYHVNSMEKAHDSIYAFDVLNMLLTKVHHLKSGLNSEYVWSTFTHNTKPQQANGSDCGLYVLHYMTKISKAIVAEEPASIEKMMEKWTSGGFNVTKATAYRSQLYNQLSSA